jgi:acylphosphatase
MVQLQVQYQGRVQGVGFRATVRDAAEGFRVGGWVRNEHDGRVTLVVQGEESEVVGLLEEVQRRLGRFITGAERLRRPIDESLRVAGIEIRR